MRRATRLLVATLVLVAGCATTADVTADPLDEADASRRTATPTAAPPLESGDPSPRTGGSDGPDATGVEALRTPGRWELVTATVEGEDVYLATEEGRPVWLATDPSDGFVVHDPDRPTDPDEVGYLLAPDCNHEDGTAVPRADGGVELRRGATTDVGCLGRDAERGVVVRAALDRVSSLHRTSDRLVMTGDHVVLVWTSAPA